jgi:polysaccharide biosynthesis/export protein
MGTHYNFIPRGRAIRQPSSLLGCAGLICAFSCADLGKYVWVENYTPPPVASQLGYVIHPGDLLSVRVYNQPEMSARERVRSDGKITLPFLYDVQAAGLKPAELARQMEVKLKEFLNLPVVSVSVEEPKQISISVVGEVARQGVYQFEAGTGLLHILALAGGLNDVAHRDRIFVRRELPEPVRIRFSYDALTHGDGPGAQFRLQVGDVVVVE